MVEIDIVSGFLGAGKTTYIKKMIAEAYHGEKIVLIENEFGETNIDSGFLREQGLAISEINSGCICCSLVGDFAEAIANAVAQWSPTRILIEPSGVGKLTEIASTVRGVAKHHPELRLNSTVTIVDTGKYDTYLASFREFYENQIAGAELLILSRTQQYSLERILEAVGELRTLNAYAPIVTTPWDQLNGHTILEALKPQSALSDQLYDELMPPEPGTPRTHHHGANDIFQSFSMETPRIYTEAAVKTLLDELNGGSYGAVLRAKGILPSEQGKWLEFDYVPGEENLRPGRAEVTGRLCVIGVGLDRERLKALFGA